MLRQAQRLQRKIEEKRKEVEGHEVTATSVGDKVKVTVTYAGKVARIEVDPEFAKSEGMELVTDGIAAAVNSGLDLAKAAMEAELSKVTGGVKVPGLT